MQNQYETECVICVPQIINAKQVSLIILKLLKIVENEKRKQKRSVSLPSQLYFKQLVDYFKLDLSKNKTNITECCHKTLKNFITKKLNITLDELYCLSQHIFNTVSKRKFELELVEKIAKNIHQKVVQTSKIEQNLETNIKNTKQIKAKTIQDVQAPTVHSIQSQKGHQSKFFDQNQQFSKLMDYRQLQNSTEFNDQLGFCLSNYGMGLNGMFQGFYGPEMGSQEFRHQIEQIQLLMSSGYFMGQRGSMRQ